MLIRVLSRSCYPDKWNLLKYFSKKEGFKKYKETANATDNLLDSAYVYDIIFKKDNLRIILEPYSPHFLITREHWSLNNDFQFWKTYYLKTFGDLTQEGNVDSCLVLFCVCNSH